MTESSAPAVVTTENVTKRYASGAAEVAAVDGLALRIERGEFSAIAGRVMERARRLICLRNGKIESDVRRTASGLPDGASETRAD